MPALRGKTVATLFFEASTRTRLSFEAAAKRLSADTMSFSAQGSSLQKGESLRDTVETLDAMGVDAMVVRHSSSGAPARVATWVGAAVVNAGDGQHEHPTQALLDCYTIREALARRRALVEDLAGLRIAIVGDVRHSRVARSNVAAFTALGAERHPRRAPDAVATLARGLAGRGHRGPRRGARRDRCLLRAAPAGRADGGGALPDRCASTATRFGLTASARRGCRPGALVMHPGPMNRGIEIDDEVADAPTRSSPRQVKNGVAVRMAVLFSLLGAPGVHGVAA